MKILSVLGTRPEAIKMAPVIRKLQNMPGVVCQICSTSQHQDMLNGVLTLFHLSVDYNLHVMAHGQSLGMLTQRILHGMDETLEQYQPDLILVHGDTTTAFAAALGAFYHRIPVAHIEAGLRSYHLEAPWPEEANRRFISVVSQLHFAPTPLARQNLLNEGIAPDSIHVTGNTVIDTLLETVDLLAKHPAYEAQLRQQFDFLSADRRMILITGHRRENFGQGFLHICQALRNMACRFPDVDWVYPVHLNPHVQAPVYNLLSGIKNIHLIAPVDYLAFVYLLKQSYFVLTDSGGIQEEAPSLHKPVLIMRDRTERPEGVSAGIAKLVGTHEDDIVQQIERLLTDYECYHAMTQADNPYGDGHAAERIVTHIVKYAASLVDRMDNTHQSVSAAQVDCVL